MILCFHALMRHFILTTFSSNFRPGFHLFLVPFFTQKSCKIASRRQFSKKSTLDIDFFVFFLDFTARRACRRLSNPSGPCTNQSLRSSWRVSIDALVSRPIGLDGLSAGFRSRLAGGFVHSGPRGRFAPPCTLGRPDKAWGFAF